MNPGVYVAALLALSVIDVGGWVILRRHIGRLRRLSLAMRGVAILGTIAIASVFAAIPVSAAGPAAVPHSIAAGLLGIEIGLALNLHYVWVRGLWQDVAQDAKAHLRSHSR